MTNVENFIGLKKKRKFIPAQVGRLDRCASILRALQMQRNRIASCKRILREIDNGNYEGTIFSYSQYREQLMAKHDLHVTIYRVILDFYAVTLTTMVSEVVCHATGSPLDNACFSSQTFYLNKAS